MDTPGVPGSVDALLAQGVLRTLWLPLFVHTYIQSGHATAFTTERRRRWSILEHRHCCEILVTLYTGSDCMAGSRPFNCVSHI